MTSKAFALYVDVEEAPRPLAGEFDEVYAIYWPQAGLEIPWPEGMTIREAVIAWASGEEGRADAELAMWCHTPLPRPTGGRRSKRPDRM